MQRQDGQWVFSATDLTHYLECEHVAWLDMRSLDDPALRARRVEDDESARLIAQKGIEHERRHLRRLIDAGRSVVDVAALCRDDRRAMVQCTLAVLSDGPEVLYQAALADGPLAGYADFLLRVAGDPTPSGLPPYEAADTKLARSPKAKFLVQLAFYSHLLEAVQGRLPQRMHLVLGDGNQVSHRTLDFIHYFRALLARFQARVESLQGGAAPAYPVPCSHCDMCHWRGVCEERRRADDHLSQVANITGLQVRRLEAAGITTLAQLALSPPQSVPHLNAGVAARLRAQAVVQLRARESGQRQLEILPLDPAGLRGLARLPAAHPADLFFDMEGSPLEEGGLEYLFGLWFRDGSLWTFKPFWAHDRHQERQAFEAFLDFVTAHRERHPGAHIYHYASYEETALKRLASQHATREVEVDNLLRERALVDLYKVVREGIRLSVPSYSIKYVEHFYRPARSGEVKNAGASIVYYERWRETRDPQLLQDIADYNRDDVESTQQLRDWLLTLRPAHLPWRAAGPQRTGNADEVPAISDRVREVEERLEPYRQRLVDPLPADRSQWTATQQLQELLYLLLDFHRREDKPQWWALFARQDMDEAQLMDDAECLGGLTLDPRTPPYQDKRSTVYTYLVPPQETKLADGDACTRTDTGQSIGNLTYDTAAGIARFRLGPRKDPLPERLGVGPAGPIEAGVLVDALYRVADSVLTGSPRYPAVQALLRRDLPRLSGRQPGAPIIAAGEDLTAGSIAAALALDGACLYVQGPPGAGKTYTGARMIAALLARGRRVGIMSNSHKAINNLLAGAMAQVTAQGLDINAVKKASQSNPDSVFDESMLPVHNAWKNSEAIEQEPDLLAGTAWLFADAALDGQLDTLFVDEAGQVALANLVAAGTCARNLILLGDQMQLSQPVQGVHPGRSGDSALGYLLDGAATIAPERGIFLANSYRMHPAVCEFISQAMYEGRLQPESGNVRRTLVLDAQAHPQLRPAGVFHVPVEHAGCAQTSEVEADLIAKLYASALQQHYTDRSGQMHPMTAANILVVAPYNAQVNLLRRRLPAQARVGTVDKFQGQEAEVVLLSMTTSSEEDLPRHLEFLYSKNRLNVAVSRARCLALVLANPRLLAIRCDTPQEMALVNTLCWLASAMH